MKKLLVGCLVVLALGAVLIAAGAFILYRAASPLIEDARSFVQGFAELDALEQQIVNTAPHSPPASGELAETQVERFVRVQEHVRKALGRRIDELEQKYQHLKADGPAAAQPSMGEVLSALGDMTTLVTDARRFQIEALNREKFSQEEYSWVRARVFQAAGVEVTSMIDLSRIEDAVRQSTDRLDTLKERLPRPEIPLKNRELVKPLVDRLDEWLPLAFFGL